MQITYHVAASKDGFIAGPDGDVSWLEESGIDIEETGLIEFMASVDGIAMGRRTYDFVFNHGSWPYGKTPAWVFTSREFEHLPMATLHSADSIESMIEQARGQGIQHLWLLGGGQLASDFLDLHRITSICISVLPVTLVEGIATFARHRLEELTQFTQRTTQKTGFEQIEMELRDN